MDIKFDKFNFRYKNTKEFTLTDISLNIQKGEKVLIVGKSGSGKSTLANCINKSIKGITTGTLEIQNVPVGTIMQDSDTQFVAQSVGEDIAFILENNCVEYGEMKNKVTVISKLVDMQNFLEYKPEDLSGGQKQKVALAGVLINDSDILIFDEPLANLDPKTCVDAMKLIDEIHKKTNSTIIIVEHRVEEVLRINIDKIIVLDDGKIVSIGSKDEIFKKNILTKVGLREPLNILIKRYAKIEKNDSYETQKQKLNNFVSHNIIDEKKEHSTKILEIKNLSFKYGDKEILNDINFSINKGEMVSIVGKNGSGKSTLANLICGFETNYDGEICYNKKNISNLNIYERSKFIGYVMQNPNHMISQNTVIEEVTFSLKLKKIDKTIIDEKAKKILKLCRLYEYRNWPISMLSYGQKKRVTLASILIQEPEILILDEPTAAQDYTHYLDIMEFLRKLNEKFNFTIIMITHDMHLMLEYTTKAIVLSNGNLIYKGNPIELLSNDNIIKKSNLAKTSLYNLADNFEINSKDLVKSFLKYEREK